MPVAPPDLAAFAAAQRRLMNTMGLGIVLLAPLPTVWPPGTRLDDNGKPLEPWAEPLSSGWAEYTCSGGAAYRVAYRRFESTADAEGPHVSQPSALFIMDDDYQAFGSAATRAIVNGEHVDIWKWVPDGPGHMRWMSPIQDRQ